MPLFDTSNRRIDYLRVSITDRCNLSCVYCKPQACFQPLAHRDVLRYEEIERIVSVAVPLGIARIRITGGEPLVRRGVLDFLTRLKRMEGIEDISLTTNGILLEEMAEGLRRAGVARLNISLDSLKADRFRKITGSDGWARVWRGIRKAEEIGFTPIKVNMVPVKGVNDDEIAEFARLTLDRNIHVRFIEFMPIGADDRWHREACVTADEVRALVEREVGPLEPFSASLSAGPSDNYRIAGGRGVIGFISPITKHFCASCRRLRLTADGKIRPCLLSDTEIDVRSPLRGGCEDAELERLLRLSLEIKPERHYLSLNQTPTASYRRTMSKIGG